MSPLYINSIKIAESAIMAMLDSLVLHLNIIKAGAVDFMAEIPAYLDNISTHTTSNNIPYIVGWLRGYDGSGSSLKVVVKPDGVKITEGSICKWYLGDNAKTMSRKDIGAAVGALSEVLHVDMSQANVKRLDVAENIIVRFPAEVYWNHLGTLKNAKRLEQQDGLYYSNAGAGWQMCFYDKVKEIEEHRQQCPEIFDGGKVLRYELRFLNKIPAQFKRAEVTAATLHNESFYMEVKRRWRDKYLAIEKIKEIQINFPAVQKISDFQTMGVLSLIERAGGFMAMRKQIKEAQQMGTLNNDQAFKLRKVVEGASKIKAGFTTKSDVITELDGKIREAVRYFR